MSDVKWIKLSVSMFDDEKIRIIESMPEADTIIICWVKLLALAGKTNANGFIFINENIPYSDEMLAAVFNRPLNTVRMALDTFRRFGMIDVDAHNYISINNWAKHQSVDRLEKMREDTRKRVAAHRERKKVLQAPQDNGGCNVTGNGAVTDIRIEEEIEIDKEIELIDLDVDKKNSPADYPQDHTPVKSSTDSIRKGKDNHSKKDDIPYEEIVNYLNERARTAYKHTTKETQRLIKARWKDGFGLEAFQRVVDIKVAEWINNPEMQVYLRPQTLFGNKFESYYNQPVKGGAAFGSSQQGSTIPGFNGKLSW